MLSEIARFAVQGADFLHPEARFEQRQQNPRKTIHELIGSLGSL